MGPESTVKAYYDALSAGDNEKLGSLFIPEFGEGIKGAELPEISITNLVVETLSETKGMAEVTAEYDVDFPAPAHAKVKVTLVRIDGKWLISSFDIQPA